MNNQKTTKRSLVAAGLVLLLCIAMLVGTTFAWFTDSASTAVNKIQAGTLDVKLLDEQGNSLEGQTLAWQKAAGHENEAVLWEPGCTYKLQPIVIKNAGNLALKYKIIISGIQGDAKLNEAIEWTITNTSTTTALDADHALAAGASDTLTISGHMKEEAGNEYQGLSIDGIAITVVATQDTVEYDSNSNQYDKDALYPVTVSSATDIRTALAGAASVGPSNIVLTNDVAIDDGIQLGVTNDTAINFNGNTLKGAVESGSISSSDGPTNLVLSDPNNSGEYSIDGNIVVHAGGGYTQLAAVTVWKPTVTIQSGKYTHDNAVILCQLQTQDPDAVGVVVKGGTFDGKGAASVIANVFGNVIVNDGVFNAHYEGESSGECVYVSSGNSYVPSITTINGGTFKADRRIFYVKVNPRYTQKIVINGGTFNVAEGGSLIQVSSGNASDYLTITGGTFNVDPSAYVDTANYDVTHSCSTWTVNAK